MIKKRFIPLFISLFLIIGLTGGTVALANGATPGDFLYPVDRTAENVRLSFSSKEQKDALRIAFSIERVEEAEHILSTNNITLSQITGTSTATSTTSATTTPKKLEAAKKGLEIALAYIEDSKQKFEDEGNANAVATLSLVAQRLSDIADNHLADLDKLTIKINDNGNHNKTEVQTISDSESSRTQSTGQHGTRCLTMKLRHHLRGLKTWNQDHIKHRAQPVGGLVMDFINQVLDPRPNPESRLSHSFLLTTFRFTDSGV
jgi:hypothetical protein